MPRLELGARFRLAAVPATALICADCALTFPYSSVGPHNMYVKTTTHAGEPFAATRAWLEVQRVTPGCHGEVERRDLSPTQSFLSIFPSDGLAILSSSSAPRPCSGKHRR